MSLVNNDFGVELVEPFVPEYIPNYKLPDPILLQKYKNMRDRIWWIEGEITADDCLDFVKYLQQINIDDRGVPTEERQPVKLFIYSNGGDLVGSYMMIDAMLASDTPVYTINAGEAMSAAGVLLICGKKRFAFKHSRSLIHTGSGGMQGDYEKMQAAMDDYKELIDRLKALVLEHTNISPAMYSKKRSRDWYQNADDQIKYGIVDRVVERLDEVL